MADALAKISGTLQEMSGEELARQQGLPAAPPTPLGAQGIGASQDVSKMAGTPNQIRGMVQGTLKERLRTKDLMQESERNGARGRFTVESLQEKMNVLEGLGSLDGRIQAALQTKLLNKTTDIVIPNTVNKTTVMEHLSSLGITDETSINAALAALDKIRKDGASATDITAALAALKIDGAITDSTTSLAGKFGKFFTQAGGENLKTQIATVLKNFSEIKMKDLLDTTAGFSNQYNNIEDVPEILGIDDEVFAKMTFGEVQAQLKAWKNRNFQDVDALRDVLQDPTYSMAEKDYARQRLAELGAIGVTSIEQKANNLEAQVAEGDTVIVGGEVVKVSELMSDPKLKGVIATALESDEELDKLSKVDKGLADWITRNKAALVPIRNELLAGAEGFAKTNKVFVDKFGDDAAVYSKLLDSIIPGWNKAKGVEWDAWSADKNQTVIAILNELPSAARTQKLNILAALPVEYAKTFSIVDVNSIAAAAKGDSAKAVELAKDWYDSSQPAVTGLDSAQALQGFAPELDADFGQSDYDTFTSSIVERFTGTNEDLKTYIDRMKKLASGTVEERNKAMQMYRELGNIAGAIKSTLSPTNLKSVKEFSKAKKEKDGLLVQKKQELAIAQNKTSLTPKSITEVLQLLPEQKAHFEKIAESFKGRFDGIGNDMRTLLAGGIPKRYKQWALTQPGAIVDRNNNGRIDEEDYVTPKLDDLILFVANQTAGIGSGVSNYSSASWGSGRLFSLRDELEAAARTQVANLTAEEKALKAESDQANNSYSIFVKGLLAK